MVDSELDVLALRRLGAAAAAGGGSGSSFFGGDFCGFCSGIGDFGFGDMGRSGDFVSGSGLASTLFSLSTVTGVSGSGSGGGVGSGAASVRLESVLAIIAAISSMVSADPERVFLRAWGSGGCGVGGFSGPFCMWVASPFSRGGCVRGEARGVGGRGASAGGGGGTGTRIVRSGFRFRLEPGGAPHESAES